MTFESEYKLEDVAAIRVAPENIDETFRSSSIGESFLHSHTMNSDASPYLNASYWPETWFTSLSRAPTRNILSMSYETGQPAHLSIDKIKTIHTIVGCFYLISC
jgi:hypothetical protein